MDVASGDLTDPAPDSTPCDDPTTDPQALEGLILEKSKDQEDAMGGAVQAEQEAEQHSVIMRVAIFTWGIHGGGADPRLLGQQHTSEGWWKKSVLKLTLQIKEFIMNAIPSYTVVRSNPPSPTPKINENQTTQLEIRFVFI